MKYFSGQKEIKRVFPVPVEIFNQMGWRLVDANFVTPFERLAGAGPNGELLPVTRSVKIKAVSSRHVCDSKCTSASGHECECSCGGINHGIKFG